MQRTQCGNGEAAMTPAEAMPPSEDRSLGRCGASDLTPEELYTDRR